MYDAWYCFSPAKNNINDAAACVANGIPSYGAAEAEWQFYNWTNQMLRLAGVQIEENLLKTNYNGMNFAYGPKILMDPMFALTFEEIKIKFMGNNRISKEATMILTEKNVFFDNLDIQNETMVCKNGLKEMVPQVIFTPSDYNDEEEFRIRGYRPQYLQ